MRWLICSMDDDGVYIQQSFGGKDAEENARIEARKFAETSPEKAWYVYAPVAMYRGEVKAVTVHESDLR